MCIGILHIANDVTRMKRLLDVLIEMMPGVSLMGHGASSTTSMTSCKEKWMSSAKEHCTGTSGTECSPRLRLREA